MSSPGTRAVGVYGGTFNPIHLGHLRAAEEAREALDLERVIFVPAAEPPLKRGAEAALAPAALRLDWVRRAVRAHPAFAVDDLELSREGPSYTVDTVRILAERLAPARPVFLLGSDAFGELDAWHEHRRLLTLCDFAVMTRPPAGPEGLSAWLPANLRDDLELDAGGGRARHREAGTWVRQLAIRALDISATDVRWRIREGRSVRYLLPETVREAVIESGVYARAT